MPVRLAQIIFDCTYTLDVMKLPQALAFRLQVRRPFSTWGYPQCRQGNGFVGITCIGYFNLDPSWPVISERVSHPTLFIIPKHLC